MGSAHRDTCQFCVFCKSNNYEVTDVTEDIHCILLAQRVSGSEEKIVPGHSGGEGERHRQMSFLTPCSQPPVFPRESCVSPRWELSFRQKRV